MSELRLPWHAGRTTGRALYDGDGPEDLIGVMDSRELAAVVVRAVNAANAAVRGTQAQESVSDEVAALTARLAEAEADAEEARTVTRQADRAARDMGARLVAVEGERDRLRRELAEMDDVAGHVAAERDDADAEREAACQQVALLRRLIHQHGITWFDPPKVTIDRLQAERDALTEHLLHRHGCDFGLAHAPVADDDNEAQAAIADAPPAPRRAAE